MIKLKVTVLKESHLKLSSQRTKKKEVKKVKDLWHVLKQINIHTMAESQKEKREKKREKPYLKK